MWSSQWQRALKSLETGDRTSLQLLIESSALIQTLRTATEQRTLRLLILQQPLGGRYLRYLTAAFHLAIELGLLGEQLLRWPKGCCACMVLIPDTCPPEKLFHFRSSDVSPIDQEGNITDAYLLRGLLI